MLPNENVSLRSLYFGVKRHWLGVISWLVSVYVVIVSLVLFNTAKAVMIVDKDTTLYSALEASTSVKQAPRVDYLKKYLEAKGSPLNAYTNELRSMKRWQEILAITGFETQFCTTGVGTSKNNCGSITNGTGGFKTYNNKLEALQDMEILLQKPLYANKTIAQMNGIYCQDKSRQGKRCENWTESVEKFYHEIQALPKHK